MPCRQTTARSLVRAALLLAALAALPAVAWAAHAVPVFQVDVTGQSAPALQQAMREALVRATGRRESASDPVFGGLIADAPKYVQGYDRGPQGELQVLFNAAAVGKTIAALDRSVWDPNRPFTLVVIYPPPEQADQAADQAGLEQAAEQRGLPISIVPLPVADDSGNLLPRESLLEMAHHYGAEQVLIGRPPAPVIAPSAAAPAAAATAPGNGAPATNPAPPAGTASAAASPATAQPPQAATQAAAPANQPAAPPGQAEAWQWTLYTDFSSQTWNGPLTSGIDNTVDLLAPPAGAAAANAAGETQIEIEGVSSLADYANIELMLGAVPGVSKANVRQVSGNSVLFDLTVRGGGGAIERALSGSPSFSRVGPAAQGGGTTGMPLVYRYRPG
ncbi:MAG TPA: DUF2066 domain-containing protein [Steroidobacteraceae bacterium]|nr:DUF2066 domain-containing protein [Steroidobacteraceae bacterium]